MVSDWCQKTRTTYSTNQMQFETKADLTLRTFPRLALVTCICLVFLLVHWVANVSSDWPLLSHWFLSFNANFETRLMVHLFLCSSVRINRELIYFLWRWFLQAETWYSKAAEFWPSNATSNSSMFSPASHRDLQQYEDRLSRFLVKFPPLSPKELLYLEAFLDKVPDTQQRNQAKLLTHRCKELEKIIRARETHLVEFGRGREGAGDKRSADAPGRTTRFNKIYRTFRTSCT